MSSIAPRNLRFRLRFRSTWSIVTEGYASRRAGEPAEGIEDVHFHPVEDRAVRLLVGRDSDAA